MKPTLLLLINIILLSLPSCKNTTTSSPTQSPNIVIIFTDDQGWQDVGCFGSPDILTPNIDKIAQNGVRFTNFYVPQPVCSASRAGLLTGCYPNRIGVNGAYGPKAKAVLSHNEVTLAEMLKQKDYATGIFGKWHLGDHADYLPHSQGFDEFFGIPYSNDMWPKHPWQGSIFNFPALPLIEGKTAIDTLEDQSMLTTQITEKAVDFINRNKENPFFLYVPHPQPHVPLFVSDKFKGKSERGLYGDVIMEIDWSVGEIMKALEANGIKENTWVIYLSDNGPWLSYGEHSGEALPLREGKGTAWEGGVRTPCVMQWGDNLPKGEVVSTTAMSIDLFPTIAKMVGVGLPENKTIDGLDIFPILSAQEGAKNPHNAYFFYYHKNELHAVLSGDWKLYFPHSYRTLSGRKGTNDGIPIPYDYVKLEEAELYNIKTDVSETNNVAAEHPEIVKQLEAYGEMARVRMGDALTERIGNDTRPLGQQNWKE